MKQVKTSELYGPALDWAVAKCEAVDTRNNFICQVIDADDIEYVFACYAEDAEHAEEQAQDAYPDADIQMVEYIGQYCPSVDWSQGGPIIEREGICISKRYSPLSLEKKPATPVTDWSAGYFEAPHSALEHHAQFGPTPLIAAMRCYCCAKLGDTVEIPEELLPC